MDGDGDRLQQLDRNDLDSLNPERLRENSGIYPYALFALNAIRLRSEEYAEWLLI